MLFGSLPSHDESARRHISKPLISANEEALLRRIGVPEPWWLSCQVSTEDPTKELPLDTPITLWVGGEDPRRSIEELGLAARLGLGIGLRTADKTDLNGLERIAPDLRRIFIFSEGRAHGWGWLALAERLTSLSISFDPRQEIDLRVLSRLEFFDGIGQGIVSALSVPTLKRAHLAGVDLTDREVLAPLRVFQLQRSPRTSQVPRLMAPGELRELSLGGSGSLDLSSIASASNLNRVVLSHHRHLANFSAVADLTNLYYIELDRIKQIEDHEALNRVRSMSAVFIRSPRADPELVRIVSQPSSGWRVV